MSLCKNSICLSLRIHGSVFFSVFIIGNINGIVCIICKKASCHDHHNRTGYTGLTCTCCKYIALNQTVGFRLNDDISSCVYGVSFSDLGTDCIIGNSCQYTDCHCCHTGSGNCSHYCDQFVIIICFYGNVCCSSFCMDQNIFLCVCLRNNLCYDHIQCSSYRYGSAACCTCCICCDKFLWICQNIYSTCCIDSAVFFYIS